VSLTDLRNRTRLGAGPCQGARCASRAMAVLAANSTSGAVRSRSSSSPSSKGGGAASGRSRRRHGRPGGTQPGRALPHREPRTAGRDQGVRLMSARHIAVIGSGLAGAAAAASHQTRAQVTVVAGAPGATASRRRPRPGRRSLPALERPDAYCRDAAKTSPGS